MRLRSCVAFFLLLSSLLSINKLFEIVSAPEVINDSFYQYEYPSFAFSLQSFNSKNWLRIVSLIHYVINDLVLFLTQMIIDILLVIQIKRDIRSKKQNLKTRSTNKKSRDRDGKTKNKQLEYLSQVSTEANKMIIYSLFFNALFRLPEFSLYFYLNVLFQNIKNSDSLNDKIYHNLFCKNQLCALLINLIQFIYLLSYSSYLFFFFKYNKSFREGFWQFFNRRNQQNNSLNLK